MGILMILFTFLGGLTLSAQSAINGTLSRKAGTIETTLLTFLTGTMFLAIFILFFGNGNVLAILEVPKWQLSAVFLGVLFLLFIVAAVPKIGVIATNITVIIGQLVIGIVIDNFGWFNSLVIPLDMKRYFALLFMFIALYFIYQGNKRASEEISA
ncbi:DMT family transporter [Alkalihalophilus lindianensis]|uniref:DMT family transporter n=1 Tax=Alkalihalophilus lindianensis TaxID=1630542 RepID=A0ABU3XCI6_9BACI|nr:DMT family transporter [Alkalihalophilus lindianensis]MDV2685598.1 DMT family transporter [Alkalihalophilus lindianensis]